MPKKTWTTSDGTEIPYKKITDKHLLNIIKFVERRAYNGMTVGIGAGFDAEECFYEEYTIKGEEVYERYDYKGLVAEAGRRKLIK